MTSDRPPIPAAMKRSVRQRCSFGCVVCGEVPYEYHHMTPYADDPRHLADNLTLLCTRHHTKATGKAPLLTEKRVREANYAPFNRSRPHTAPDLLYFDGDSSGVVLGTLTFTVTPGMSFAPILIDGIAPIVFTWGTEGYELSLDLRDANNRSLLIVNENELIHRTDTFDVERVGNRLLLREAARSVFVDMRFDAGAAKVTINRAGFWMNGIGVQVRSGVISFQGKTTTFGGTGSINAQVGIMIGKTPAAFAGAGAINLGDVARSPYAGDGGVYDQVAAILSMEFGSSDD